MRFVKLLGAAVLTAGLAFGSVVPAFASTHHPVVSMTEISGAFYTGAEVFPGEPLTFNRVTYDVQTVTPVFRGIHTGQSVVTFASTAGLPVSGDVNVNFDAKLYR